jgi:SAM-dependent methyltransferase
MPSLEWNRQWGDAFRRFRERHPDELYGNEWGDPELRGWRYALHRLLHRGASPGPLHKVVDRYIQPYLRPDATVVEIGCGGGRWTRYLVGARKLIAVDINAVFFEPLRTRYPEANLQFYQSSGFELHAIPSASVDYLFSFGTFVHLEPEGIAEYLGEVRRVLKPGAVAVIQYAAKEKPAARHKRTFSAMTAERMAAMAPMPLMVHDTGLLNHSNIAVFRR